MTTSRPNNSRVAPASSHCPAVAIIHVLDLPATLSDTPLIGGGYFVLIGAALGGAALLMTLPGPRVWVLADLIGTGAIIASVLSRTAGLPTYRQDIGNWNCALGIGALCTETLIVLLAAWRMRPERPRREASHRDSLPAEPKITASVASQD
jgi:hypothetical protein